MDAYWLMNKKKTNFGTFAVLNCGLCGSEVEHGKRFNQP